MNRVGQMKLFGIVAIVIVIASVAGFLFLHSRVAESGTLTKLPERLAKLKRENSDPKAFLGFCTCDEDALYFVHEDGVFYLDYELTTTAKKSHANSFRTVAQELSLPVIDTSYYGQYPVLRVKAGDSEPQAAKVGLEFSQRLFRHDQKTIYEFLP